MRHLAYRPEIDGLRALAIISVLIFHLNSNWLPGGFLGVDIFFVISGFLITKIITNEILDNRFSYKNFYNRRIKRIYPVFILVMAMVSVFSSLIFLRHEAEQLRKTIELATVFFSNFYLAHRQGYFDLSANENPVLHIWSLAVEEQYYLLFPIFLTLAYKKWKNKQTFLYVIVGLFILFTASSFIPNEAYSKVLLHNTYYISNIRFPELLIGSFLAIIPTPQTQQHNHRDSFISLIALFGIVACLVFFHKEMDYLPGISLLIPCAFTALLIYFSQTDKITKGFFSLKPVVFVGKISYSLYLFHWVYIAFAYYITGAKELNNSIIIGIVLLSFLSSTLTYYLLEQPIRKSNLTFKQAFLFLYLIPSLAVIGYNLSMRSSIKKAKELWETSTASVQEKLENHYEPKILTIGDSHADHLYHFLNYVGNKEGWKSNILNVGECILFVNKEGQLKNAPECTQYWQNIEDYPVIFISMFYDIKRGNKPVPRFLPESFVLPNFDEEFRATVEYLAKTKKVYVLANNMSTTRSPLREFRLARFGIDKYLEPIQELGDIRASNAQIRSLIADIPNVTWIDAPKYLPNDLFKVEGQPIYADQDHFTHFGSYYLGKQFSQHERLLPPEVVQELYQK